MSKSKFLTLLYNVYFIRKFLLDIRKNIRNRPVSIQDVYRQYVYISWTKTSNFPVASFFFFFGFFLRRIRIYLWPHCPPKNLIAFVNAIDLKHFVFLHNQPRYCNTSDYVKKKFNPKETYSNTIRQKLTFIPFLYLAQNKTTIYFYLS